MNEAELTSVLRRVAIVAMPLGAIGSVMLMLHAARRQESRVLMLIFGVWVLSPFLGALVASSISKRWAAVSRATLYVATIVLTLASLAIYADVAFGYAKAKVGFVFLVVPLASWFLMAIGIGTSVLISRRHSRRNTL